MEKLEFYLQWIVERRQLNLVLDRNLSIAGHLSSLKTLLCELFSVIICVDVKLLTTDLRSLRSHAWLLFITITVIIISIIVSLMKASMLKCFILTSDSSIEYLLNFMGIHNMNSKFIMIPRCPILWMSDVSLHSSKYIFSFSFSSAKKQKHYCE